MLVIFQYIKVRKSTEYEITLYTRYESISYTRYEISVPQKLLAKLPLTSPETTLQSRRGRVCAVNKCKKPRERKRNIRNIQECTKSTISIMSARQPHMSCIWFFKLVPYMAAASRIKKIQINKVL